MGSPYKGRDPVQMLKDSSLLWKTFCLTRSYTPSAFAKNGGHLNSLRIVFG